MKQSGFSGTCRKASSRRERRLDGGHRFGLPVEAVTFQGTAVEHILPVDEPEGESDFLFPP